MSTVLFVFIAAVVFLWAFARFYLRGPELAQFDEDCGADIERIERQASAELDDVLAEITDLHARGERVSLLRRLKLGRELMNELGQSMPTDGFRFLPVDIDGLAAEWVLAENAAADRRLLFIHGGGFSLGSPLSHRSLTMRLARIHNTSVLAIDYRLLPENHRLACLEDTKAAYRWILDNGPQGAAPVSKLFVCGDSAGGNLTLAVIAWARDAGVRAADAAIALSPSTDSTFSGASCSENAATDALLGPALGKLLSLPQTLLLYGHWLIARVRPSNAAVSPLHGDLSNLPPTLIQGSECELLRDDAIRYTNKAHRNGSPVSLQLWPHLPHVWQLWVHKLPEAKEAFQRIEQFMMAASAED